MIHNLPTQCSSINKKNQDRESILILLVHCFRVINTYVANRQFYEKKRKIFIDKLIRCIRTSTTGYALALQIKLGKKWNISSKQEFFKQIQNFYYEYRLSLIIGIRICFLIKCFQLNQFKYTGVGHHLPHVFIKFKIT